MQVVVGHGLMGFRELWKVPSEPNFIEVAQVVLAGLNWFEDIVALHVVQWCGQRIRVLRFLARVRVVTGHLIPFIPLLEALTAFLVPPHAKVYIHAVSKTIMAGFPFFLGVFAVQLWQRDGLRGVGVRLCSFPVWPGLLGRCFWLRGTTATFTSRLLSLAVGFFNLAARVAVL